MTVSVFVGTSVDGFIARPNGDLDFLPPGGGEPHGYNEFIATVHAVERKVVKIYPILTIGVTLQVQLARLGQLGVRYRQNISY